MGCCFQVLFKTCVNLAFFQVFWGHLSFYCHLILTFKKITICLGISIFYCLFISTFEKLLFLWHFSFLLFSRINFEKFIICLCISLFFTNFLYQPFKKLLFVRVFLFLTVFSYQPFKKLSFLGHLSFLLSSLINLQIIIVFYTSFDLSLFCFIISTFKKLLFVWASPLFDYLLNSTFKELSVI